MKIIVVHEAEYDLTAYTTRFINAEGEFSFGQLSQNDGRTQITTGQRSYLVSETPQQIAAQILDESNDDERISTAADLALWPNYREPRSMTRAEQLRDALDGR